MHNKEDFPIQSKREVELGLGLASVQEVRMTSTWTIPTIVVTYEIRVFFEGAQKEVFSSI